MFFDSIKNCSKYTTKEIVNITADISENIFQLEESISEIHTRKLNKELKTGAGN